MKDFNLTTEPEWLLGVVLENHEQFSHEFIVWLPDNRHMWSAFVAEAHAVVAAGFQAYSSKTIVHVLRHHTALREKNSDWKFNNNLTPYLTRLYQLVYPERGYIFKCRATPKAERDNHHREMLEDMLS